MSSDELTLDGPIVLATDGTRASQGALRFACREAGRARVPLRVVHVAPVAPAVAPVEPSITLDLERFGRQVLDRAVEGARVLDPGLEFEPVLVRDSRVHGIVEAARDARLAVLGRETRHGLDRLLTGATTVGVAAHARCPVIAVPDTWTAREVGTRRVVVGLRGPAGSDRLLSAAFTWAAEHEAEVHVVHAWELPDPYIDQLEGRAHGSDWEAAGLRMTQEALAAWQADDGSRPPVEIRVVHGQPAAWLAQAAMDADLLVVRRAHERRPWDHLGSTVRALLLHSPTPVMVVPSGA